MKEYLKSLLCLATVALVVSRTCAQPFAIEPVAFVAGSGISSDGVVALSGAMAPAAGVGMSRGDGVLTGEFHSVGDVSRLAVEELIVNGSFENTAGTHVRDANGLMALPAGSGAIPGWQVTSGEAAWADNANAFNIHTPFGSYFLDLTGYAGGSATLAQTIQTVPGRKYRLSLSVGSHASFAGQKMVSVCAGTSATLFILSPTNSVSDQWGTFSFPFVAAHSATEIVIRGVMGNAYIGLDNVSVVADDSVGPQNLVVNGSFEIACPVTFVPDGNGLMSLSAGSALIPGWRVAAEEIAWGVNGNAFGPQSPFGSLFLDLTGYHDSFPYGGVTQTLNTTPNQSYQLTFSLGSHQDVSAYRGPMTVSVTAGSTSNSFTFTPSGTGSQWGSFAMGFVAESTTTPLTFVGTGAAGGAYLGFDNVVVTLTPELQFYLTAVSIAGNNFRFRFADSPGGSYVVESRNDLTFGGWAAVPGAVITNAGGMVHVAVPIPASQPRQFYRVKKLP